MNSSRIVTLALGVGIVLALRAFSVWGWSSWDAQENNNQVVPTSQTPSPKPKSTKQPKSEQSPSQNQNTNIPEGWTQHYDGALQFGFAAPANWEVRPATSQMGEAAVYSFDVSQSPATGGVPQNKLKIATVFFPPNDERRPTYQENEVLEQTQVTVTGQAPGTWFFEGQLSLELQTVDGKIIAQTPATSSENWMTVDQIPFTGTLEFSNMDANFGYIVIKKANPSGLPRNQHQFYWPVQLP